MLHKCWLIYPGVYCRFDFFTVSNVKLCGCNRSYKYLLFQKTQCEEGGKASEHATPESC